MFVLITVITMILSGPSLQGQSMGAHTLASMAMFWPSTLSSWLLYLAWGLALLYSFVAPGIRPGALQYIAQLGATGNMHILNVGLFFAAILLACLGWILGNTAIFVPGVILTLGLIGNGLEQRALF